LTEQAILIVLVTASIAAVAGGLRRRRRSAAVPRADIFSCRVRPAGPRDGVRLRGWRAARARWVHDVLVVEVGTFHRRTRVFPVRRAHRILDLRVRPLRRSFTSIHLELDDGSEFEVTTTPDDAGLLAGPFVTTHPVFGARRSDRTR
jgi:hypothetical protein